MSENIKGLSSAFATIISREDALRREGEGKRKNEEIALVKKLKEARRAKTLNEGHVKKIDILKKDLEKGLRKIATKGVVTLFNAVRQFQDKKTEIQEMPIDNFMQLLQP